MIKKLCSGQLADCVTKVAFIISDLSDEDADKVLASAKHQVISNGKERRKEGFSKFFDDLMKTLDFRGCPKAIVENFVEQKPRVLETALAMDIPEGHISFLPVIPRNWLSIYTQAAMMRNGDKIGYTYLDPNKIKAPMASAPYFIFDVSDGREMLDKSADDAKVIIDGQKYFSHVPEEDMAIVIHTADVLNHHYLLSSGSRYESGNVPCLCLDGVARPRLGYCGAGYAFPRWGSAFSRSRSRELDA